ncbi:MAG: hypothetical protein M1823_002113 [Watsoniomyces obsoletus]|nr:MAG: hypothetical protein M1823_002113 [Watsoniomyces obsoletus]
MHHLLPESMGPAPPESVVKTKEEPLQQFHETSSGLPFGRHVPFSTISGPTYVTAQVLVQQTAFALSDAIYTYSPETFDLDLALQQWTRDQSTNAYGYVPRVTPMQIRPGAGSVALGRLFSKDFDIKKRHVPQTIIASSAALRYLRTTLEELSYQYGTANPTVVHLAAVDYVGGALNSLITDYASPLALADELGLGLLCSTSTHEAQHMALLSTLLARIIPTVYIYDGVAVSRETTRVIDVLDGNGLHHAYRAIEESLSSGNRRVDLETRICQLLTAFNDELGTAYDLFEFQGHPEAEQVLVVFGTTESRLAASIVQGHAQAGRKVGVLSVRVYRPFVEDEFIKALPRSVRTITVLGQVHNQQEVADASVHSILYDDVLASTMLSQRWRSPPRVVDLKYPREYSWTPRSMVAVFQLLAGKAANASRMTSDALSTESEMPRILDPSTTQQYVFWDLEETVSNSTPSIVGQLLAKESSQNVTVRKVRNNVTRGGTRRTDIRVSKKSIEVSYPIDEADCCYVGDLDLFKDINILRSVKPGGIVLVRAPGVKDDQLESKLSGIVRQAVVTKWIKLYLLDPQAAADHEAQPDYESYLTQLAFLKLARPELLETGLAKLATINGSEPVLNNVASRLGDTLREIEIPEAWAEVEIDKNAPLLPTDIGSTNFASIQVEEEQPPSLLRTWRSAAKGLAFKEAYGTKMSVRPDLSVKTWTVRVKENRRLTPITYERNIFHIEFDLGDSGLRYDIGEALGIHAENDEAEVREFIQYYGLDPDAIVEVPSREDPSILEARTVYQSMMQNIDIFGRPPKKFYEALAEFADDEQEKLTLLSLASPAGATEFKRRAEVDTVTYADILLEFPSAHPSFHDIVRIVSPMKRREYSIASSQKVTPRSVALLIVTVNWVDPKGRDRFGQATRYLHKLKVDDIVTVSVKPSVMKLPSEPTQPLIMAGLGTGLAPFRAFVQYRAWQKAQGIQIGSVLLYMGSRTQREEYLYGEEWEAYQDAGVITLLGRAFSRDQPQKIYIQDRMRQTMTDIVQAYIKETGSFYLCGPTWPVPDVTEVLQEAITLEAKIRDKKVDARREIERLKDDGRYVLEVY